MSQHHHIAQTLHTLRLMGAALVALMCCGLGSAPAWADSAPRLTRVVLYASAKCLDDPAAPYSIPATTYNPVIFQMSLPPMGQDDGLEEELGCDALASWTLSHQRADALCSELGALAPVGFAPQALHVMDLSQMIARGDFIPASITLELPAQEGVDTSCAQLGADGERCQQDVPMPLTPKLASPALGALHPSSLTLWGAGLWAIVGAPSPQRAWAPLSVGPAAGSRAPPEQPPRA